MSEKNEDTTQMQSDDTSQETVSRAQQVSKEQKIEISEDDNILKIAQNNSIVIKNEILDTSRSESSTRFSVNSLKLLSLDESLSIVRKSSFLIDEELSSKANRILNEYHFLLIFDTEMKSGRNTAIRISQDLNNVSNIYICEPLRRYERINFVSDFQSINDSIVIFKSATGTNNIDILDLFNKIETSENLGRDLPFIQKWINQNIYFAFVVDFESMNPHSKILQSPFALRLKLLDIDTIEDYLKASLTELLIDCKREEDSKLIKYLISDQTKKLTKNFSRIDTVDLFVYQLYEDYLALNITPTNEQIDQLFLKTNDLRFWLIETLGKDIFSWNFVLSAALMHSYPNSNKTGINLLEFELFRQELETYQRRDIFAKNKEWFGLYPENALLRQARMVKNWDEMSTSFTLIYREDNYSEFIWDILFNHISINLIQLIPFLEKLIESGKLSSTASRVLGRLLYLDTSLAVYWISQKSESKINKDRILVGFFLEGVLSSNKFNYISTCKRLLHSMNKSENFYQLWCCISAYARIGIHDMEYALANIGDIVENKIAPSYEEIRKLRGDQDWVAGKVEKKLSHSTFYLHELLDLIKSAHKNEQLKQKIEIKKNELENYEYTVLRIIYTIVSLCSDSISVFNELHKWWNKNNRSVQILTVKMVLGEEGILYHLNQIIGRRNDNDNEWEEWHKIILDLSAGKESVDVFIEFLKDIVETFPHLERGEGKYFENRLLDYINEWVTTSINNEQAYAVSVGLYHRLIKEVKDISLVLERNLTNLSVSSSDLKLKTFATKVKNEILEEDERQMGSLSIKDLF